MHGAFSSINARTTSGTMFLTVDRPTNALGSALDYRQPALQSCIVVDQSFLQLDQEQLWDVDVCDVTTAATRVAALPVFDPDGDGLTTEPEAANAIERARCCGDAAPLLCDCTVEAREIFAASFNQDRDAVASPVAVHQYIDAVSRLHFSHFIPACFRRVLLSRAPPPLPPALPPAPPPLECPCLDSLGSSFYTNGSLLVSIQQSTYAYPPGYGLTTCSAHDVGSVPYCNSTTSYGNTSDPEWCTDEWCWVDPSYCNVQSTASSYLLGRAHYSYAACGHVNDFSDFYASMQPPLPLPPSPLPSPVLPPSPLAPHSRLSPPMDRRDSSHAHHVSSLPISTTLASEDGAIVVRYADPSGRSTAPPHSFRSHTTSRVGILRSDAQRIHNNAKNYVGDLSLLVIDVLVEGEPLANSRWLYSTTPVLYAHCMAFEPCPKPPVASRCAEVHSEDAPQ